MKCDAWISVAMAVVFEKRLPSELEVVYPGLFLEWTKTRLNTIEALSVPSSFQVTGLRMQGALDCDQ